jgi:hypothetical protein
MMHKSSGTPRFEPELLWARLTYQRASSLSFKFEKVSEPSFEPGSPGSSLKLVRAFVLHYFPVIEYLFSKHTFFKTEFKIIIKLILNKCRIISFIFSSVFLNLIISYFSRKNPKRKKKLKIKRILISYRKYIFKHNSNPNFEILCYKIDWLIDLLFIYFFEFVTNSSNRNSKTLILIYSKFFFALLISLTNYTLFNFWIN